MNNTNEDTISRMIKQAYRADNNLRLPANFNAQLLAAAHKQRERRSWMNDIRDYFSLLRPATLSYAFAGAAAVAIVIFILMPSYKSPSEDLRLGMPMTSSQTAAAADPDTDPLGPDFFSTEGLDREPTSVEVADGWNAVTIEDEESDTTLVYFYSDDEITNATQGVQ